jgi:hypothetical protein
MRNVEAPGLRSGVNDNGGCKKVEHAGRCPSEQLVLLGSEESKRAGEEADDEGEGEVESCERRQGHAQNEERKGLGEVEMLSCGLGEGVEKLRDDKWEGGGDDSEDAKGRC